MADPGTAPAEGDPGNAEQQEESSPLGEAGEKALAQFKARARAAERRVKELEPFEAQAREVEERSKTELEKAVERARRQAAEEVKAEYESRLARDRLTAALVRRAFGVLADPDDAPLFIDLDQLDPDDTGALDAAVAALAQRKPHLAATATRTTGFDGGPRGAPPPAADMNLLIRRAAGRA